MSEEDKDEAGGPGAPGAGGVPAGLTEEALYGGGGGEGESDKGGDAKPKPKPNAKAGEDGDGEGGEEPPAKPDWDKDRQQRDQEHAAERRALMDQNAALQETTVRLLERLEKAAAARPGSEAADDLADLSETIKGLTEDSDPAEVIRAMPKILDALKKVRQSGGANAEVAALKTQLEEQRAALEELRTGASQSAADAAYAKRKERLNTFLALKDKDKDYGPELRAEAIRLATQEVVDLGYTGENPCPEDVMILALKSAYRDARDQRNGRKKPRGGGDLPLDNGKGGAPPKAGRKTGSLSEVLGRMKREGKVA